MAELHVAHLSRLGLLRRAHRIARDASAHVLEPDRHVRHEDAAALGAAGDRELAQHVVLHEGQDVVHALVLVVMGVDVDDQDVVELALLRLLTGVGEQAGGVELLDRHAPAAIGDEVHGVVSLLVIWQALARRHLMPRYSASEGHGKVECRGRSNARPHTREH